MNALPPMKFGVGQPAKRVEDQRLLTGGGRYTSDLTPEAALHAITLRSPHAHADFTITDVETARGVEGVRLILTSDDIAHFADVPCLAPVDNGDGSKAAESPRPVLAKKTARYVGEPVAFIVADTVAQARDAAEAIVIDWSPKPAASDIRAAMKKGAPLVWPHAPGNIVFDTAIGNKRKVDAIFRKAPRTVKLEIENNRLITNYMETRACIAEYDAASEGWTLTVTSQGVHNMQGMLAMIMKSEPAKLRILTPDVGGGFGTKGFVYNEYAVACEAAKLTGKPVQWVADRSDHFVSDAHGRDSIVVAEAATTKKGEFLAMRFDWMGGLGAYLHIYGPYIHYLGATMLTGVYKTPAIYARVRGVFSHTTPVDAYRGAGRPEAAYVLERLVDRVARELKLPQEEIRKKNFISAKQMPYKTPIADRTYDTGDFAAHMAKGMASANWKSFDKRAAQSQKKGKLRGIGLATYIECTAWGEGEDVNATLEKDGTVTVLSGTQTNGQGHATAYAQFVSQHLDLPLDRINVVQGDTARIKTGHGTGGSRSIPVGGIASHLAGQALAKNISTLAADVLEASTGDIELVDGDARIKGTDRRVSLTDLANSPKATPELLSGDGSFTPPDATYPNGTHIAEVEIDPDTGTVTLASYNICDDFGRTVNPLLLAGQVHGGVVQGIGQALLERTVYDRDGQLLSASFMDYCMPRADDLPPINFQTLNVPSTTNPLGIKGAGEAGSIGSCPAVMNAVVDALDRGFGVRHIDMPATPHRVRAAIAAVKKKGAAKKKRSAKKKAAVKKKRKK
ncbi:xanthine dehydrogenase family protein molybdopterin-binding subunit [Terrarubrum flagellatum]|uniref:xanthine dehydrogenase family protein molybdopterin-binding subunit n=1 Tax=Terrirubrum flagellatum TaxID=2895980 RepID=UPI003144E748